MGTIFINRDGLIRLYDSTATPWYLELSFDAGDLDGPLGIPHPEEILKVHRGKAANGVHYISGPDDAIYEPLPITFSAMIKDDSDTTYLKDWIDSMNDGAVTTVNAHTIVGDKGSTQRVSGVANPAFSDSLKETCAVEIVWNTGGTDFGIRYNEVFFDAKEQKIKEGADGVVISLSGQCYGTIVDIAAFTSGTDVTA